MPGAPYVFMVPGFLGFVDLGHVEYFRRAAECLGAAHGAPGGLPTIVRVETHPSASLRERAARLAEAIREHARDDSRPVHLVAHSTGGLDARLLLTPGASLPVDFELERVLARVRSLVTIATPHHGTPLASFFDGLLGQRVLRLGSQGAAHALRLGRLPLEAVGRLLRLLSRPGKPPLQALTGVEGELLDALPADERGPLQRLLERMAEDQALVPQLAPEGLELFNTSTNDRPGVRYGCVLTRSPRPGIHVMSQAGVSPLGQTSSALYSALHQITSRMPSQRSKSFDAARRHEVAAAYGGSIEWSDSDGVVPTLSQVWGELVHAAQADHLDIVGHFADSVRPARHRDLLVSGACFGRAEFEAVWRDVAGFMRGAESPAATLPPAFVAMPPPALAAAHPPAAAAALAFAGPATPTLVSPAAEPVSPASGSTWRRAGVSAALRLAGITAAFAVYEAWCILAGDVVLARWVGFALCVAALWLVPYLARRPGAGARALPGSEPVDATAEGSRRGEPRGASPPHRP